MKRLLLDLAESECQLATLAMANDRRDLAVRSLERAARYLSLRGEDSAGEDRPVLPMWGRPGRSSR